MFCCLVCGLLGFCGVQWVIFVTFEWSAFCVLLFSLWSVGILWCAVGDFCKVSVTVHFVFCCLVDGVLGFCGVQWVIFVTFG